MWVAGASEIRRKGHRRRGQRGGKGDRVGRGRPLSGPWILLCVKERTSEGLGAAGRQTNIVKASFSGKNIKHGRLSSKGIHLGQEVMNMSLKKGHLGLKSLFTVGSLLLGKGRCSPQTRPVR